MACKPTVPSIFDGGIVLPNEVVGMDLEAFDNVVRGKGVPCIHHRAMKCPVGMIDQDDIRKPHADHIGCSNGMLYTPIGRVTVTMTSNSTELRNLDMGFYDGSSCLATFPRFYDSDPNKRVIIRPYDRIYFEQEEDMFVGTWEVTARRLDGRDDQMEFPIVQVENLVDSSGTKYKQGIDFDLSGGNIKWRDNKGPELGTVYSVWFLHVPFYYVDRLIHEIRLFPTRNFVDPSQLKMTRLGSGAVLQREYVYRTQHPDNQVAVKNQGRQKHSPDQAIEDDVI
jgi:hypothetical protein